MRVLKLWIVIDDDNMFDLAEEKPIMIEVDHLPMKITANNGFHSSKPFYIKKNINNINAPLYIQVGCTANNRRFWGAIALSILFLALFFISGFAAFLVIANIPFLFLMYRFFVKHQEFITVSILNIESKV
jgi:hypothetical protein